MEENDIFTVVKRYQIHHAAYKYCEVSHIFPYIYETKHSAEREGKALLLSGHRTVAKYEVKPILLLMDKDKNYYLLGKHLNKPLK